MANTLHKALRTLPVGTPCMAALVPTEQLEEIESGLLHTLAYAVWRHSPTLSATINFAPYDDEQTEFVVFAHG